MTLRRYLDIMVKQWKIVFVCLITVGVSTFIGSKFTPHVYQATALIQVDLRSGNNQIDNNSLLADSALARTESSLAVSEDILRRVVSHRKDVTLGVLMSETTSSIKLNTQIFEIDVQDPNPKRAADLANDIARSLIDQQTEVAQRSNDKALQQVQQEMQAIKLQIEGVTRKIAILQADNKRQTEVDVLQTQLAGLQQRYNQWDETRAQLELTKTQSNDVLRIVQTAQPGTTPVRPNMVLNTIAGLVMGLLLGICVAILYEIVDTRVHSPLDVAELLGYPLLATMRYNHTSSGTSHARSAAGHVNGKAYRMLLSSMEVAGLDKPIRSLMVTSALTGEGKSSVAAHLATQLANMGKKTLLVDTNVDHPPLHTAFDDLSHDAMGLHHALRSFSQHHFTSLSPQGQPMLPLPSASSSFSFSPYIHAASIANLYIMPLGSASSDDPILLNAKLMGHFLGTLQHSDVDVVIFDAAPLLDVPETRVLATRVDATLIVSNTSRVHKNHLIQMKAVLQHLGSHVLGCVVNERVRKQSSDHSWTHMKMNKEKTLVPDPNRLKNTPVPSSSKLSSHQL